LTGIVKRLFLILIGIGLVVLQWLLQAALAISGSKPHFVAIFTLYLGLLEGGAFALWIAFLLGLYWDALTATDFLGLSALGLVCLAYLGAIMQTRLNRIPPIWQYLFHLVALTFFFSLTLFIYYQNSDWSAGQIFFLMILPNTFYTFFVLIPAFLILRVGQQ